MRRFLVLALMGCASGTGSTAGPADSRPSIEERTVLTDDRLYRSTVDSRTVRTLVPAPREKVWAAVEVAYNQLGIDVKTMNPNTGELGNIAHVAQRQLAGKPLSNFLNCGTDVISGPIANTHRIQLSLLTTLSPDSSGTYIESRLAATARKIGTSNDPLPCSTTGRLEQQLNQKVLALLP